MKVLTFNEAREIESYRETKCCKIGVLATARARKEGWKIYGTITNGVNLQYLMVRK